MSKKNDYRVTYEWLVEQSACPWVLEFYVELFGKSSVYSSVLLKKLEELASTNEKYVNCADWFVEHLPFNPKTLVIKEITGDYLFYNGNVEVKKWSNCTGNVIVKGWFRVESAFQLKSNATIQAKEVYLGEFYADDFSMVNCNLMSVYWAEFKEKSELWAKIMNTLVVDINKDAFVCVDVVNAHKVLGNKDLLGQVNLQSKAS